MPATKNPTDQQLDDLVELQPDQLDALIIREEAKLRVLKALRGGEPSLNGHIKPKPKPKAQARTPGASEEPSPKPKTPTAPTTGTLAERAGTFLKMHGPKRRDGLRNALGCSDEQIETLLEHAWFTKDNGMITLSTEGHTEFSRGQDDD
jgi:hypothetical protein